MRIDTEKLLTVRNFAKEFGVSRQRLYKIIDDGRIHIIEIDGVKFVHKNKLSKSVDR